MPSRCTGAKEETKSYNEHNWGCCIPVCAPQRSLFLSSLQLQEFLQQRSQYEAAQGDNGFNHHQRLPSWPLSVIKRRPAGL